jgi:acetyl-CoA acyltransferase
MNQLARQFEEDPSVRFGMTTMCIGLGMGATVIWENPRHSEYTDYSGAVSPADDTASTDPAITQTEGAAA